MKKNLICVTLATTFLLSNLTSVFGATQVFIDNVNMPNISIEIVDSTTFVPIRTVAETLGYKVNYDSNTKTIYVGDEFSHVIGSKYITLSNGKMRYVGVPSYVRDGVTYVSLRLFSEGLGYEVNYDPKTKDIWIYTGKLDDGKDNTGDVAETYDDSYSESLVKAEYKISGNTASEGGKTINANGRNESSILVDNNGKLTLTNVTVNKIANTTSLDGSSNYGLNSAVLVKNESTLTGNTVNVSSNAIGGNGLYFDNSKGNLTAIKMNVTGENADAIDVKNNSTLDISSFNANLDNNYGTVLNVENSKLSAYSGTITSSKNDLIKSSGELLLSNVNALTTFGALGSFDGESKFTSNNSTLTSTSGNSFNITNSDKISTNRMYVNLSGGEIKAPYTTMFTIEDNNTYFDLNKTKISDAKNFIDFKNPSKVLKVLSITGSNQKIIGSIVIDDKVETTIRLTGTSYLKGAVNEKNKNSEVVVDLDASTTWDMTGPSYVNVINPSLKAYENINSNGYNVYYDENYTRNNCLLKKTYKLKGDGKLLPN